jgi:hypothetical protein
MRTSLQDLAKKLTARLTRGVDPRWKRRGKDIVWEDGALSYVFFKPWRTVTLPFHPRLSLTLSWWRLLLLPQATEIRLLTLRTIDTKEPDPAFYSATKPEELRFI